MNTARTCFPFSASQYQELEHQVLIFKQMASGFPIPSDLLYAALDSSVSSDLLLHQPHHLGWSYSQMGSTGRKIDPEPGRCRRTDGKKWRCAKLAYIDSKYCERHMHRGKNRSRKPVECNVQTSTALPFSSITRNTSNLSPSSPTFQSFSSHTKNQKSIQHPYLYNYHHSSGSPKKSHFSSQDNSNTTATNFILESDPYSYIQEAKVKVDEQPFLSETSGTMRSSNISGTPMHDSWLLAPLTMGSPASYVKQSSYSEVRNVGTLLQLTDREDDHSNKVMHHFFDKQNARNLWQNNNNDDDLSSIPAASSNIQLSISIPISSHDFFLTRENEK